MSVQEQVVVPSGATYYKFNVRLGGGRGMGLVGWSVHEQSKKQREGGKGKGDERSRGSRTTEQDKRVERETGYAQRAGRKCTERVERVERAESKAEKAAESMLGLLGL
jgi:hypothetical protein